MSEKGANRQISLKSEPSDSLTSRAYTGKQIDDINCLMKVWLIDVRKFRQSDSQTE